MATMSVPPEDASRLNRIAEPSAGRDTAKISSISGWEVIGAVSGRTRSSTEVRPDISRLTYTVLPPKPLPNTAKPSTSSATLMNMTKSPREIVGKYLASTTAIPVTPPVEKLFGNLKK